MKRFLLATTFLFGCTGAAVAQSCSFDAQITTSDSVLCAGDSTLLTFPPIGATAVDSVVPTPIVNNNGQDGNMFNITATNTIRVTYFEGLIANTPNPTTQYYIYYKVGTHVGFENNAAAWTLLAGPITVTPNAPNVMTVIPYTVNMTIPAGQTYAFYLTNTSAASNNNRYHTGTATGNVLSTNADLTIYEGTGGAYPFGTFFNARPWEGIVHYDIPPTTYLWNTGATTNSITVQPAVSTPYSCVATVTGLSCTVEDTITVTLNPLPVVALGNDTSFCTGNALVLDAGYPGSSYTWCSGDTTQTLVVTTSGTYCAMLTDANGCSSTSDSVVVIVNPLPSVTATGDTICAGSTGMLSATGTAVSYEWNAGAFSGATITDAPAVTTTYTVSGTDGNGCASTATADIVVNPLPVISVTSFGTYCFDDNVIVLTGATPAGGMYAGPGVNADSLYPSVAGVGTHMISYTYADSNGCSTIDSAAITIDLCLGLQTNNALNSVTVYPNPMNTTAIIAIGSGVVLNNATFSLYDVNGALVKQISAINSDRVTLDRAGLASGVYFFTLVNEGSQIGTGKLTVE